MRSFVRRTLTRASRPLLATVALALAPLFLAAGEPPFIGPEKAGKLAAPPQNETSGIAASRRTDNLLWVHDDSGGQPVLYGVATDGSRRGALRITGGFNQDWEDVASFVLNDKAWLLIGDIGDNNAKRPFIQLYLIEEPPADKLMPDQEFNVTPTATWRVTYDDGPHDCESLAVDPVERAIYLLTKRDSPPRLYRIALPSLLKGAELAAHQVGLVAHLPQPSSLQSMFKNHLGAFRGWPCAMDFSPDGSRAVVLTYGDVLIFPRPSGETWAAALAREPLELATHELPQAEAVCFSRDGAAIYVASESSRKLLRYDRRGH